MAEERLTLQDRVGKLRSGKFSQTELAERADLAPAALSRILSGERTPKMEHLLALASALEVTVAELVDGTDAASAISDWVRREDYEAVEAKRLQIEKELLAERAQVQALGAEGRSLKAQMSALQTEIARLSQRVAEMSAEAEGERARREASEAAAQTAVAHGHQLRLELERTQQQLKNLRADLERSGKAQVATGVVAAALGALAGAVVASETTSSRKKY